MIDYVIIPTWRDSNTLRQTLDYFKDSHIIVINNDYTCSRSIDGVTVINNKRNEYGGYSLNKGIEFVKEHSAKYHVYNPTILFANDDNTYPADFAEKTLSKFRRGSMVCNTVYAYKEMDINSQKFKVEGIVFINWKRLKFVLDGLFPYVCCSSRALLTDLHTVLKVGTFSRLIPHYLSDYDYTLRASKRGIVLIEGEEIWTKPQVRRERTFSLKNPSNPLIFTIFILKHCPFYLIPLNVVRVWAYSIIKIIRK